MTSFHDFSPCDLVIENLETKHAVFDGIEAVVRSHVPIASNTSSIPIALLQKGRKYPERFMGMHWAEPSHVTRFMELIRGPETSGSAMYREACNLLDMGVADVETIDRSCRNAFGIWASFCGPFRMMDLTGGPALYGRVMSRVLPSLYNDAKIPPTLEGMVERNATGVTDGYGFYPYAEGDRKIWEEKYLEHAWKIREMQDHFHPLDES